MKRQGSKTQSSRLINVFKPQCSIVSLLSAVDKGLNDLKQSNVPVLFLHEPHLNLVMPKTVSED